MMGGIPTRTEVDMKEHSELSTDKFGHVFKAPSTGWTGSSRMNIVASLAAGDYMKLTSFGTIEMVT